MYIKPLHNEIEIIIFLLNSLKVIGYYISQKQILSCVTWTQRYSDVEEALK